MFKNLHEQMQRIETAPQRMSIEDEQDFENIKNGRKTKEIKLAQAAFINFKPQDRIIFGTEGGEELEVKVVRVSKPYQHIEDALKSEGAEMIFPGLTEAEAKSKVYKNITNPSHVDTYGFIVIEFKAVNKDNQNESNP